MCTGNENVHAKKDNLHPGGRHVRGYIGVHDRIPQPRTVGHPPRTSWGVHDPNPETACGLSRHPSKPPPSIHLRHEPPPHLRPLPAGTSDLHPGSAPSPRNRHPLPKKTTFILGAPAPSPAHFSVTAIATHPNHHSPIHLRHERPPHLRPLPARTNNLHPGGHHVRGMHPGVSRHSGRFAMSSRVTSRASSRLSFRWTFSRQTPPAQIDVRFDQSGSCAIQS